MGAAVSIGVSKTENEIITKSVNQCKKATVSNEMFLQGITHDPAPTCKNPTFSVQQSAVVDADCFINSLQNNMADSIKNMKTTTQVGFGIAGSTSIEESKQKINAALENACGGVSATQVVNAKDIRSRACDMTFIQNANAKSKCKIDALQDAAIKTDTTSETGATGASLSSLLFGTGSSLIIWIIVIVVVLGGIGGLVYYMKKKKTDDSGDSDEGTDTTQEGGANNAFINPQSYPIIIGIVVLALIAMFISRSKLSDNTITMRDLENFQTKVTEAQCIARQIPRTRPLPPICTPRPSPCVSRPTTPQSDNLSWPNYSAYEKANGNIYPTVNLFTQEYYENPQHRTQLDDYYGLLI